MNRVDMWVFEKTVKRDVPAEVDAALAAFAGEVSEQLALSQGFGTSHERYREAERAIDVAAGVVQSIVASFIQRQQHDAVEQMKRARCWAEFSADRSGCIVFSCYGRGWSGAVFLRRDEDAGATMDLIVWERDENSISGERVAEIKEYAEFVSFDKGYDFAMSNGEALKGRLNELASEIVQ